MELHFHSCNGDCEAKDTTKPLCACLPRRHIEGHRDAEEHRVWAGEEGKRNGISSAARPRALLILVGTGILFV